MKSFHQNFHRGFHSSCPVFLRARKKGFVEMSRKKGVYRRGSVSDASSGRGGGRREVPKVWDRGGSFELFLGPRCMVHGRVRSVMGRVMVE